MRRGAAVIVFMLLACDREWVERAKAPAAPAPQPPQPAAPAGKVVAELDLGQGHVVVFEEIEPGVISVIERGSVDDRRQAVTPGLMHEGAAEVWSELAPGREMPPALAAAIERQEARRDDPEAPASPSATASPSLPLVTISPARDSQEQQWFRDTFCTRDERIHCTQGWEWASSISDANSGEYEAVALQGREGTQTAVFTTHWWKCRKRCELFDCDVECWWELGSTDYVAPGTWVGRHYANDPGLALTGGTTYKAELTGATGALVSLRAMWEPWRP
jgi:hypothetical protein